MRQAIIFLILSTVIFSCSNNKKTEVSKSSNGNSEPAEETQIYEPKTLVDSVVIIETVNGINYFDYKLRSWNSIPWEEYEMTGNPDTAVSIHAYRLITSKVKPDYSQFDTYINLYEKASIVKQIIKENFSSENDIELVYESLDNINEKFVEFAQQKVDSDMKEYGQSDGPYYSFLEKIKK